MINILTPVISIFIILFLLIFAWILKNERKESNNIKLFHILITSFIFSSVITFVLSFILFVLFGSVNLIDTLYSLKIPNNKLLLLAISFFIYLFTIDVLIEYSIEIITGKNFVYTVVLFFTRILAFYTIGALLNLERNSNILISIGIALIIFIIELYSVLNGKKQSNLNN